MFCYKCGKEIPAGSAFCPFCGVRQGEGAMEESSAAAVPPSPAGEGFSQPINTSPVSKAQYNLLCILGLVISAISLVFNYFGLVGLGGTIVSVIGIIQCNRSKENGRILGVLGVLLGAVSIIQAVTAML